MKLFIYTNKGLEKICEDEVKSIIKSCTVEIKVQGILVSIKESSDKAKEKLVELIYKIQSAIKVILLTDEFNLGSYEEIEKSAKKINCKELLKYLNKESNISFRCTRSGEHNFSSLDFESLFSDNVIKNLKKEGWKGKVNLDSPDIILQTVLIDSEAYFGIDLAGRDLGKRAYRIFNHPQSLKPTIAYGILKIAKYKPDMNLLDPFAGSGTIPIEAAYIKSNLSINYYNKELSISKLIGFEKTSKILEKLDKKTNPAESKKTINSYDSELKNLKSGSRNAKIGGVEKYINFSKSDVEWLDTKFDRGEVDIIVTHPPTSGTKYSEKKISKLFEEFFHQIEFILKKEGIVAIITKDFLIAEDLGKPKGFKKIESGVLYSGAADLPYVILKYSKS